MRGGIGGNYVKVGGGAKGRIIGSRGRGKRLDSEIMKGEERGSLKIRGGLE